MMPQNLNDDKSNIGSGNGLVLSDNKPLPDPVLTEFSVTILWPQLLKQLCLNNNA